MFDKKYLLLIVAIVSIALYFYGSTLNKDSPYLKSLPILGGLAYGLTTLVQLAH